MRMLVFILVAGLAIGALPAGPRSAAGASDSAAKPALTLVPCPELAEARCGTLDVFEDRAARSGRTIPLHVVVLPASGPGRVADPLFLLAGGPGQGATTYVSGGPGPLALFRTKRDVVMVDQRGTGKSGPLPCALFGKGSDPPSIFADIFPLEEVRACRAALEKRADLTRYGTSAAMDDLDDVRAALGYDRINLYGGSYGTFAAQVYLKQHPDRVRSVVLDGVASLDYKLPLPFARGFQNAMDRLLSDCAADSVCAAAAPRAREHLTELLSRLEREPARFVLDGKEIVMGRGPFVERLRLMLYSPELSSLVPLMLRRAHEGDYGPFARVAVQMEQGFESLSFGMYLSVTCSEMLGFATPAEIERATAGTYMKDYRVRTHARACEGWPRAAVDRSFLEPVVSDAPVLLMSGELDPVTPPGVAEGVAAHLKHGRLVKVPNGSHFTGTGCTLGIISAFLDAGSAEGLDVSCVAENKRPPFPKELPPMPGGAGS